MHWTNTKTKCTGLITKEMHWTNAKEMHWTNNKRNAKQMHWTNNKTNALD